jgi:hypothetical protein
MKAHSAEPRAFFHCAEADDLLIESAQVDCGSIRLDGYAVFCIFKRLAELRESFSIKIDFSIENFAILTTVWREGVYFF